jgi:hypothetical protein
MAEQAASAHDSHNMSPLAAQIEQLPDIHTEVLSAETNMLCMIPASHDSVNAIATARSTNEKYSQRLDAVISAEGQTFGIVTLLRRSPMRLSEFTRIIGPGEDVEAAPPVVPEKTDTVQALVKVDADGNPVVIGDIRRNRTIFGTHGNSGEADSGTVLFAVQELNGAIFVSQVSMQGSTTVLTAEHQSPGGQLVTTNTYPLEFFVQPKDTDQVLALRDNYVAGLNAVS